MALYTIRRLKSRFQRFWIKRLEGTRTKENSTRSRRRSVPGREIPTTKWIRMEQRGIAIIRKNCLFAGSEAGGQRLAILYSFAATCKANGICFRKWLEDVLPRLNSTPAGQIDSLIPKGEAK